MREFSYLPINICLEMFIFRIIIAYITLSFLPLHILACLLGIETNLKVYSQSPAG